MTEEGTSQVATEEEKKTNRTFTQSDYDRAIALERKSAEEKYKDYEVLKQKATELEKWQADQEAAKLSEVEKYQKRQSELEDRLKNVENEKNLLSKTTKKLSVLSDPKYQVLPEPYKKIIDGDDEATIRQSADTVLQEFAEFMKNMGYKASSGLPPDLSKQNMPAKPTDAITLAFEKRFGKI